MSTDTANEGRSQITSTDRTGSIDEQPELHQKKFKVKVRPAQSATDKGMQLSQSLGQSQSQYLVDRCKYLETQLAKVPSLSSAVK
jgi:hypothetical protein